MLVDIDACKAELKKPVYLYQGLVVQVLVKTEYGVTVLEETGRRYILLPTSKLQVDEKERT